MIGDKLKKRREELGLTQADLEKLTGIGNRMISNYEKNNNKPNDETILVLMKALQCDANYLFDYQPQIKNGKPLDITPHEERLIKAYRQMPEMHLAIDRLLGIEEPNIAVSQKAARSGDGRAIDTVKMTSKRTAKFENAETDDDI